MREWCNSIDGVSALAVDQKRVLLWGGYGEDRTRCVVQTMAGDRLVSPLYLDLRLPTGESLEQSPVIGRGSILHTFVGSVWYQFDLVDLPCSH